MPEVLFHFHFHFHFRNFKVPNIKNYNEFELRFVLDWIICGLLSVPVIDFIGFLSSLV